jgi:hypothetical protein
VRRSHCATDAVDQLRLQVVQQSRHKLAQPAVDARVDADSRAGLLRGVQTVADPINLGGMRDQIGRSDLELTAHSSPSG